jgi:hypothetical protein
MATWARNVLRGRPFKETDPSITKAWKFNERLSAQFRAEFLNIFNAVEFSNPGQSTATCQPSCASTIWSGQLDPEYIQFYLREWWSAYSTVGIEVALLSFISASLGLSAGS